MTYSDQELQSALAALGDHTRELLETMIGKGVEFTVSGTGVMMADLTVDEVIAYCEDPHGTLAKVSGLTPQEYTQYLQWENDGCPCTGQTRKGKRCRNEAWPGDDGADQYKRGISDRCKLHKEP